jgi:hypothetical protein
MSRRAPATGARSKRRRGKTLLWVVAVVAIVFGLLYWEKIALLYVLATLGVTALMIGAAMADLAGTKRIAAEAVAPSPPDDAAAIGTGIGSAMPSATGSSAPSATRRK